MRVYVKFFIVIIPLVFFACNVSKINDDWTRKYVRFEKKKCFLLLPKSKYEEQIIISGTSSKKEVRFIYSDSSIVFFTNDNSTSLLSEFFSPADYFKLMDEDELKMEFLKNDSLKSILIKKNEIIYGYKNVINKNQEKFDELISKVKIK